MSDDHTTVNGDSEYEVTLHPAFASSCVLTRKNGEEKVLYKQQGKVHLKDLKNNPGKHPKKHRIRLKGKANGRDITLTIDDPNHAIHCIRVELYDEGRDPEKPQNPYEGGDVITFLNMPVTCPPDCEET